MELTERKKKVLRSVVDLYIRTAEPVGSKAITELPDMKYSSATIRNEMADLTTMGYLEQPHTSAGRIPSAAGYRLYVTCSPKPDAKSKHPTARAIDDRPYIQYRNSSVN